MRFVVAFLTLLAATPCWAGNTTVRDGGTLDVAGVTYRLDGIDAPAVDQTCIDEHADSWTCGVNARERLSKLIGDRNVRCKDLGTDATFKQRHAGVCTIEGDKDSLNLQLVRTGFAISAEPALKGSFKADEATARDARQGLWRGCFVAPQDFRRWSKTAPLLGASCPADKDKELREALFPEYPVTPPGCTIKGKYSARARVTGHVGIYHLPGCRSYASLARLDRWFCSAEDAQANGFRKAFNCLGSSRRRP
ncbi:thermonuclease family protein [soil metagenome]